MKVVMMEMMIVLSVNSYGDYTKGERLRYGLFVTCVMAMSALTALQKGLLRKMILLHFLFSWGKFERVSDKILCWFNCFFLVLLEERKHFLL